MAGLHKVCLSMSHKAAVVVGLETTTSGYIAYDQCVDD